MARRVCTANPELMVVVDGDTGYGNPLSVRRTVDLWEQAGATGIFIEDQVWPKRCGHMDGKEVVPVDDWLAKLAAAVEQRTDLFVTARTDARAVIGLDEAIDRARAAVEVGVDAVFVEAPESIAELQAISESLPAVTLVANMVEGGKTPLLTPAELPRPRVRPDRVAVVGAVRCGQGHAGRPRHSGRTRHVARPRRLGGRIRRVRRPRRPRPPPTTRRAFDPAHHLIFVALPPIIGGRATKIRGCRGQTVSCAGQVGVSFGGHQERPDTSGPATWDWTPKVPPTSVGMWSGTSGQRSASAARVSVECETWTTPTSNPRP